MRLMMLLISLLLLAGCAPSKNQLRMETDLDQMKRHLARLEVQQADSQASGNAGNDTLERQVAEVIAGLDNLRVEFQSINGRLDDMGNQNQQLEDEVQLMKDDLGLQLTSLTERLDQLEQNRINQATTAAIIPTVQPTLDPIEPAKPKITPEQMYQQALDLVRKQKHFGEGREQLEQFVKIYPDHELAVNALYWSGEAFYGEKNYEAAILRLQDVISKHSKHSKASAAMFKQALAFKALGDQQNAETTMQKLILDYPNSEQVNPAKKFLEK